MGYNEIKKRENRERERKRDGTEHHIYTCFTNTLHTWANKTR